MNLQYCTQRKTPERAFGQGVSSLRARSIISNISKWANGTRLHYFFFDNDTDGSTLEGTNVWRTWKGSDAAKDVVRSAFSAWKNLGIGLEFEEVQNAQDAEIRIGFMQDDGSWSYVGREVLNHGPAERTMNFGWDITVSDPHNGIGTAIHEIGHSLGLDHEHQNPNAGIVWNEEAVYTSLGGNPNFWSRQTTFDNILKKFTTAETTGSTWDPDSIMEYPFDAGLIKAPAPYQKGLFPPGTLSTSDISWVLKFYPSLQRSAPASLQLLQSTEVSAGNDGQQDFSFRPTETRYYDIQSYGSMDHVMVLFEKGADGKLIYLTADDNAAQNQDAHIRIKLFRGKQYVIKMRVYYKDKGTKSSVMIW